MTIGELAARCEVNVDTIRYYERRGLLPDPRPRGVGYRHYTQEAIERFRVIQSAKRLGFTLKEIKALLKFSDAEDSTCETMVLHAERKRDDLREKIHELEEQAARLERLIETCSQAEGLSTCSARDLCLEGEGCTP